MIVSIIVAMAENRVIGQGNAIPWHLPADLAHFKRLTLGHSLIMGRRTFDSLGRRPLPQRRNLIITRQAAYDAAGVGVFDSLDRALGACEGETEVFICGGGQLYKLALPLAARLYLTRIHAIVKGDVFFPELNLAEWELAEDEYRQADKQNACPFSFQLYLRKS